MKLQLLAAATVAAFFLVSTPLTHAQARIVLNNLDAPGVGLNDVTPAMPSGGNPGTTLGEQRRIAYQYAMDLWGALLRSGPEIRVSASFAPLQCTQGRIVLGQAGTIGSVLGANIGAPADFRYPVALANAIAGKDFTPSQDHIRTFFSGAIDTPECQALGGSGWYYGVRGNGDNSKNRANFLNVVMHEIGHGLGVSGQSQLFFGIIPVRFNKSRYDQLAWSNQFAKSFNDFDEISDPEMGTALTTPGDVVWTGTLTNPYARLIADHRQVLKISTPQSTQYDIAPASFGNQNLDQFPAAEVMLVRDAGAVTSQGCESYTGQPPIANADALKGKIALIDRGNCEFGQKALNAQKHGAVAVLVANNVPGDPFGPGPGSVGNLVTIPVVGVSQTAGQALRSVSPVIADGVVEDATRFYGLDTRGQLRLYAPATWQGGSSFSHVDTDMAPNALMEPAETSTLQAHRFIDVALNMFEDLGWPTNRRGTAWIGSCDTGIPVYQDGNIPGASIVAQNNLCLNASGGQRNQYMGCMDEYKEWALATSLLTGNQGGKLMSCAARAGKPPKQR